jgi:hypothetical protein
VKFFAARQEGFDHSANRDPHTAMAVQFSEHVALLREFLERRHEIVDRIDSRLLNVQGKDAWRIRSRAQLERLLDSCFFGLPRLPDGLSRLNGQLAAAHLSDGFEPIVVEGYSHQLDPLELVVRAYQHWDFHRWPGRNIRVLYASRVYAIFIVRQLEQLSLRIWDEGEDGASDRLEQVQGLLDRVNDGAIADPIVRDARWLIQTAQGPLTRRLHPYFQISEQIAGSFTDARRLEVHQAGARLAGGHLRSQLRYRAAEVGRAADDPEVLAIARNSNSMDAALLVRDLVPLLDAYGTACAAGARDERLDLADAIIQGVSADPELFLTRLDLLTPCSMIEDLFVERAADGVPRYTTMGATHRLFLEQYGERIGRHASALRDDALELARAGTAYSPLGLSYGFCADLLSHMAFDTLLARPAFGLGLEDMFRSRGSLEAKRARAENWQALSRPEGGREHFDHSAAWAAQMFDATTNALAARARDAARANASDVADARLFVVLERHAGEPVPDRAAPDGIVTAQEHCVTSDLQRALASGATAFPRGRIVNDRNEARFLASAETGGQWFGVSKVLLTLFTSQGRDALLTGVPRAVVDVLLLTCPGLIVVA